MSFHRSSSSSSSSVVVRAADRTESVRGAVQPDAAAGVQAAILMRRRRLDTLSADAWPSRPMTLLQPASVCRRPQPSVTQSAVHIIYNKEPGPQRAVNCGIIIMSDLCCVRVCGRKVSLIPRGRSVSNGARSISRAAEESGKYILCICTHELRATRSHARTQRNLVWKFLQV